MLRLLANDAATAIVSGEALVDYFTIKTEIKHFIRLTRETVIELIFSKKKNSHIVNKLSVIKFLNYNTLFYILLHVTKQ